MPGCSSSRRPMAGPCSTPSSNSSPCGEGIWPTALRTLSGAPPHNQAACRWEEDSDVVGCMRRRVFPEERGGKAAASCWTSWTEGCHDILPHPFVRRWLSITSLGPAPGSSLRTTSRPSALKGRTSCLTTRGDQGEGCREGSKCQAIQDCW